MIWIYDWHGCHDYAFDCIRRYAGNEEVKVLSGISPGGFFDILHTIERTTHIFMWNGSDPGCTSVRALAESHKIPVTCMEVGWFNRSQTVHFDGSGVNASSSWMTRELNVSTPATLESLRLKYFPSHRYSGKDSYVLIPLQMEEDTNIYVNSPFKTMNQFLQHCKKVFSKDQLVVRPHPGTKASIDYAGVRVERGGTLVDWAQDARLVYGINSNSLFESYLIGTPTTAVGKGLFMAHQGHVDKLLVALDTIQFEWAADRDLVAKKLAEVHGE